MKSAEDRFPVRKEIRRLDTLRGCAALIVVISHYANEAGFLPALGHGAGQFGVMLFFLLSGFLMAFLYFDQPADAAHLRAFAVARFARIAPLFLLVSIASYLLTRFAPAPFSSALYGIGDSATLISHILFLYGVSVFWSIPLEKQSYLVFGLAWVLRRRAAMTLPLLLAAILVAGILIDWPHESTTILGLPISLKLFTALPYFAAGSAIGTLYGRWQAPPRFRSHLWVLVLFLIPVLYPAIFTALTGHTHGMWSDVRVWLAMTAIFAAIVFLVPEGNPLLENPVGDFFGRVSYSIYLWHVPVLWQLERAGRAHGPLGCAALLGITSLVAAISYRAIETPARRYLRDQWSSGVQASQSPRDNALAAPPT